MTANRRLGLPDGRRMTHRLLLIFAVVALAAPALALGARIERISGQVETGRGEPPAWSAAQVGESLAPGDSLRTGRDGRAELSWQGATIRLYGDSLLRIPSVDADDPDVGETGVALDGGSGLFDVKPHRATPFEVRTPDVVVSVKGTRFSVSLSDGPADVAVYRGTVGVRALALEHEVFVREGFRAIGGGERPAELFLLDGPDPWEQWGPKAVPPERSAQAPASSARRAVEDAQRAGRAESRARALRLALERDPGIVERIERLKAKFEDRDAPPAAHGKAGDLGDRAMAKGLAREAVLDRRLERLDKLLETKFVREWLNRGMPGAGASGLDVRLNPSGQVVQILDLSSNQSWSLNRQILEDVKLGAGSMPPGLATRLQQLGINDEVLAAEMILSLL